MNRHIIQKLNDHVLGDSLASEAGVTYLLVQLAKLVEREDRKGEYPHLVFYRNWAVHSKLDRTDALITKCEKMIEQGGADGWDVETIDASLAEEMKTSLMGLRTDIRKAFGSLRDTDDGTRFDDALLWPDSTWWNVVRSLLLSILSDIPLVANDGNIRRLLIVEHTLGQRVLRISGDGEYSDVEFDVP